MSPLPLGIVASSGGIAIGTYELIESQVLTSSASSVTFSSIPQDYKHLQIRAVIRDDLSGYLNGYKLLVNNDTASNYTNHYLYGNGSTVTSTATTPYPRWNMQGGASSSATTGNFAGNVIDLLDHANTSKNTTMRALQGLHTSSSKLISLQSGSWMNTTAVSRLDFVSFGNFMAGSRFSLYGVKG